MALRKGDAQIEFFSLLPKMKKMYQNNGIVVAKRMFEILQNENNISMGYKNFSVLFRRNLIPQKEQFETAKKEPQKTQKNVENLTVPEIIKLVEEGKLSDELIKQLEEAEKISFNDLPKDHDLWMPKMPKTAKPRYVHNAGVPEGAPRF